MGIKSTRTLKRSEALEMYRELHAKLFGPNVNFANRELGNMLEEMQDTLADREGWTNFDNYNVVDDEDYERLVQDWERY